MKENELMVGDLVYGCTDPYNPDEEQKKFPVKVIRIDLDGDIYTMGETPSDDPYDDEWWNIEPIPITPEILEKNGFRFVKADRMVPANRYFWDVEGTRDGAIVEITFYDPDVHGVKVLTRIHTQSSHESGINSVHSCDIESVHELQHALRLCGIKKEIKI